MNKDDDPPRQRRRVAGRASVVLAVATLLILAAADPARADTSQAAAQAATLQLLGQPILTTGQVVASNDGTSQTKSGDTTPALSVLGGQTILTAGSLFQDAVANTNGTSAACAGVIGPNGSIQIGPDQRCQVSGAPSGVVVNLGLVVIRADAITAECTASSDGTTTGSASLTNVTVTDPTGTITFLTLPVNPPPNTGLNVPGIVELTLNQQTSAGPGQLAVTALEVTLLSGLNLGNQVRLGFVACGPNAQTAPIPLLSAAGLPVAGATLLGAVAALWFFVRRRASTRSNA